MQKEREPLLEYIGKTVKCTGIVTNGSKTHQDNMQLFLNITLYFDEVIKIKHFWIKIDKRNAYKLYKFIGKKVSFQGKIYTYGKNILKIGVEILDFDNIKLCKVAKIK